MSGSAGASRAAPRSASAAERPSLAGGVRLAVFSDTWLPQVNGVTRTLDRLVKAIRARGGDARAWTTSDPGAQPDADIVRYPSRSFWAYPQLQLARPDAAWATRELTAFRPTLVHASTPFGIGLGGRSAAKRLGVPFVTSYHTSLSAYAKFYHLGALSAPGWAFLRWFHNSGRRTYCPTRAIERELVDHAFAGTRIWSRGIDAERFSPSFRSPSLRAELGVSDDTFLVTYIGRIALEKGLDTLVKGMREIVARTGTRKIAFALAGDGPYDEACRREAPAGTRFVGMLAGDRLSAFYASGDLFVFPSVTDTFGNVLLEAMASGLPVLGADSGPTRELLDEGRGALFPAANPGALATAVLALADDPARRVRMREAGLAYARVRSWDAIFDDLVLDYREAIAEAAAEAAAETPR
ncbi:MAG: glycosyltransferase family 1 protein [Gemmatimonadetes bacterium]|nr:glycosyltransferase family 1 protein [Gemmatimonadota bacterium]